VIAIIRMPGEADVELGDNMVFMCADKFIEDAVNQMFPIANFNSPADGEPGLAQAMAAADWLGGEATILKEVKPAEPGLVY